jgi:hypothetical protein
MDLYAQQQQLNIERRRVPGGPTLGRQQVTAAGGYEASRNGSSAPRAQH